MSVGDSNLVGKRIWLEYFDQNYKFEEAFTPQYCTIRRQYADDNGGKNWHLIELDIPFVYEGATYDHLLIGSRWVGGQVGAAEPTAVFIVLVPNPDDAEGSFLNQSLYIAWGFTAQKRDDIKREI